MVMVTEIGEVGAKVRLVEYNDAEVSNNNNIIIILAIIAIIIVMFMFMVLID